VAGLNVLNVARTLMTGVARGLAFQHRALPGQKEIAGRESRLADLVERQSHFVFRIAYAVLRDSHDSEDVVQETFLKLYRSRAWEAMRDEKAYLARRFSLPASPRDSSSSERMTFRTPGSLATRAESTRIASTSRLGPRGN
jgi:hypothetical protein